MTHCESYPPCFGTIYFPTAPFLLLCHSKTEWAMMPALSVLTVSMHSSACVQSSADTGFRYRSHPVKA